MNVERIEQILLRIERQIKDIDEKVSMVERIFSTPSDYKLPNPSSYYTICELAEQKERAIELMKKYPTWDGKIDYGHLQHPHTVYGTHTFLDCPKQVDTDTKLCTVTVEDFYNK